MFWSGISHHIARTNKVSDFVALSASLHLHCGGNNGNYLAYTIGTNSLFYIKTQISSVALDVVLI